MTPHPKRDGSDDVSGGVRPATRHSRRKIFEEARAIVFAELAESLKLTDLARRLSTSPRQLQRAFAESCGLSFREYLVRVRMNSAARLLEQESLTVAAVARAVSYGTGGQFSRAFQRFYGVTPGRYRQTARAAGAAEPARGGLESTSGASESTQDASLASGPHLQLQLG